MKNNEIKVEPKPPKLSIIAAVAKNMAIGNKGKIPWHISDDLKHFKEITTGHPVIMGRLTYESIGGILPDRTNIIVSTTFDYIDGERVVKSLQEAMQFLDKINNKDEAFIIGGARLFREGMKLADKLYITEIENEYEADVFFPEIGKEWELHSYQPKHDGDLIYRFLEYIKWDENYHAAQPYLEI